MLNTNVPIYYILVGLALLGLTLKPRFSSHVFYNVPAFYVIIGFGAGLLGMDIPTPLGEAEDAALIQHAMELIVLISLAGAGLSINLKASWMNWRPVWLLLAISMPLTIAATAFLGVYVGGLSLASAVLLGACLAPTDPVLARSVQVGPATDNTHGSKGILTTEAGLNDGLAFPFVWLAILMSGTAAVTAPDLAKWFGYDVLYRITVGILAGLGAGWALAKLLFSSMGDAGSTRTNPTLVVLSSICVAYGAAELFHGYGFLAVFVASRAGRRISVKDDDHDYLERAHLAADQLESILMALLLLWLGAFVAIYIWQDWVWTDLVLALLILVVIRPVASLLALLPSRLSSTEKVKVSVFGIRGMGTIFYLAFAQNHGLMDDAPQLWRIVTLTILISIFVHGCLANVWMSDDSPTKNASKAQ